MQHKNILNEGGLAYQYTYPLYCLYDYCIYVLCYIALSLFLHVYIHIIMPLNGKTNLRRQQFCQNFFFVVYVVELSFFPISQSFTIYEYMCMYIIVECVHAYILHAIYTIYMSV